MSSDPLLPVAPARVKALLLPLGKLRADKFAAFADRLRAEHVVQLRDISADGRPNRNMFSPLAYPDGAILYDLITHVPPASHLALSPFELCREPLAVIAIADGAELQDACFSKRHSAAGAPATNVEKSIRALYQELEHVRDVYPRALVHQAIIFDYSPPSKTDIPMPEGVVSVPPAQDCKRTTMKTVMCDVSSMLLAEMSTLAKSFEAMTTIESPGHPGMAAYTNGGLYGSDGTDENGTSRRSSQYSLPQHSSRPSSAAGLDSARHSRLSMPPMASRPPLGSSASMPARPSTPVKSGGLASIPMSPDDGGEAVASSVHSSPESKNAKPEAVKARDRIASQGFNPGGFNDRGRTRTKGRAAVVIGSMYLQAGRWSDALKELTEAAATARSVNDHIWHGKALELLLVNLFLLAWSKIDFQVPVILMPPRERSASSTLRIEPDVGSPTQPKHHRDLQSIVPELLERIVGLYSRISAEHLPPLPLSDATIRFAKILTAMHLSRGRLNQRALDMIVCGTIPPESLTKTSRLNASPPRPQIVNFLFRAFPTFAAELLTPADRAAVLSGMASVLGSLGFHRKKAMVIRELVSVLIAGLVEARTRGAAEAGVHPAAGLLSMTPGGDGNTAGVALDLGEGDIEHGLEAFLGLLCRSYGVIGFEPMPKPSTQQETIQALIKDSDEAVIARVLGQSTARFYGFTSIKLNILRACINFSEALPDFNGVLKFSSDLLRTGGSGIAPGPRREDAAPMIHRDEQVRLMSNVSRTAGLAQRIGMNHLAAEYWDEFLVRNIVLEPLANARTPIPHARSVLPGAAAGRASQDVNPFIYNPFLKEPDQVAAQNLVAGEQATFRVTLQNTYDMEVDIESIRLCAEGVEFEVTSESVCLGPYRSQLVRLRGRPLEAGPIIITGAVIKIRGCRERRFPIFTKAWMPSMEDKMKGKLSGGAAGEDGEATVSPTDERAIAPRNLSLNVVQAQPLVVVKSTTLPQCSVMILEGERQTFSVTLENRSATPVDFMLFSFKDSTQAPLQEALSRRDATPAELYEYELILTRRQALRLPHGDQGRSIAPGGETTVDFEILGKPGLTQATIQVDYTWLGVPRDEVTEQFYTRQVCVDLTVTVNASVELTRVDALPMDGGMMPQPLWERLGGAKGSKGPVKEDNEEAEHFLLYLDLRNAWPSHMVVRLEGEDGLAVEEEVLPGKTTRVAMPVRRMFLEEAEEAIPSLNPSRSRQFVVSSSKMSPDMERANREAFWYREKMLEQLKATWRTTSAPKRRGAVELRSIRLTPRMMEAIKEEEVEVTVTMATETTEATTTTTTTTTTKGKPDESEEMESEVSPERRKVGGGGCVDVACVDEFLALRVEVRNRTSQALIPLLRVMPALCHRPMNVALEHMRKFAWNGTLQQLLPALGPRETTSVVMGVTALCRGDFEIAATVEEVQRSGGGKEEEEARAALRTETQRLTDTALGVRQRRMWHSRRPLLLTVREGEEEG